VVRFDRAVRFAVLFRFVLVVRFAVVVRFAAVRFAPRFFAALRLTAPRFAAPRFVAPGFAAALRFRVPLRFALGVTRSGSSFRPVSWFHRSYASSEIFPVTRSSANFRRWALLLKGMAVPLRHAEEEWQHLRGYGKEADHVGGLHPVPRKRALFGGG
jgi:hypothetical protein